MLSVYLICVGKLKEKFYQEACAEYIKRLSPYCRLTLVELPEEKLPQDPSQAQIDAALEKESQAIRAKLPPQHQPGVPVRGGQAALQRGAVRFGGDLGAQLRQAPGLCHRRLLRPGGAPEGGVLGQAVHVPHDLPHHLARVMLLEQLYRAFKIREGSSYHK